MNGMMIDKLERSIRSVTRVALDQPSISVKPHEDRWPTDLIVPIAMTIVIQLTLLALRPSLDGHESLVAQTAREMVRSGNYIDPTFAGEPRWQKPPLAYWLASASYLCTGDVSAWTARLPSALAAVGLTMLAVLFTRRVACRHESLAAGVIQSLVPWSWMFGSSAMIDMTLSFLVAAGIYIATRETSPAVESLPDPLAVRRFTFLGGRRYSISNSEPIRILGLWGIIAMILLAKGPVGLIMMIGTLTITRYFACMEKKSVRWSWHVVGIAIALVLAGTWPAMVLVENQSLVSLWFDQSVGRFIEHWGPQTRPWYYYLYQVPVLVGPSIVLALLALINANRAWSIVLVGWFLFSLILLSFSEGKRDHYILPALLPWSIWAGIGWQELVRRSSPPRIRWTLAIVVVIGSSVVTLMGMRAFPGQRDLLAPVVELADRNKSLIQHARGILQVGSNNHATAFVLDRPMRWCEQVNSIASIDADFPFDLVLCLGPILPSVPSHWNLVDRQASSRPAHTVTLYRLAAPYQN
jgi:4-amino-4-deoxy-L-arabinose transferase-like glycosyltransferase